MQGSALVSEGGRWPQNSLTGPDPTSKLSTHGIAVVEKVISGITIVSINSRSVGYCVQPCRTKSEILEVFNRGRSDFFRVEAQS